MKKIQIRSPKIKNVKDGEVYICVWSDCGVTFEEKCINVDGIQYWETNSCYHDTKTKAPLDCFYRYDENNDYWIAVKNLNGSIEVH